MVEFRRKRRKGGPLTTDYINNKQFHQFIVDWYFKLDSGTNNRELPRNLINSVLQICKRLATKYNFANYTFIDEMEAAGVEKCIKALMERKYDPTKYDNPFAYFTTCAWYEFIRIIKEEEKERYIKQKSYMLLQAEMTLDPNQEHDLSMLPEDFEINYDLISKYEKKKTVEVKEEI